MKETKESKSGGLGDANTNQASQELPSEPVKNVLPDDMAESFNKDSGGKKGSKGEY
jgi:hypothetical protein